MKETRIVATAIHNETEELEVIIEVTEGVETFTPVTDLYSVWINTGELVKRVKNE